MTPLATGQVDRVLASGSVDLSLQPETSSGGLYTFSGDVSVSVTDGSGTAVHTGVGTVSADKHALEATVVLADTAPLDTYDVVWTAKVDTATVQFRSAFETCGGFLFSAADFRRLQPDLASRSATLIAAARYVAEERIERACGCAFVPRGQREELTGDGTSTLLLLWPDVCAIYSLAVDGTELSEDELAALTIAPGGIVRRDTVFPDGASIRVHYRHGSASPPAPVRQAAVTLAAEYLAPPLLPARATSLATDIGNFRITVAGRDGATGIPEVDAVIAEYSRRRPQVG